MKYFFMKVKSLKGNPFYLFTVAPGVSNPSSGRGSRTDATNDTGYLEDPPNEEVG